MQRLAKDKVRSITGIDGYNRARVLKQGVSRVLENKQPFDTTYWKVKQLDDNLNEFFSNFQRQQNYL